MVKALTCARAKAPALREKPQQTGTWDIIEPKLRRSPQEQVNGWGLKIFP